MTLSSKTLAALFLCCIAPSIKAQSKSTTSAAGIVAAVGFNCTSDKCSKSIRLNVELSPNAWVKKTHCYTTANYPNDFPPHDLHEVSCGADVAWSDFETPITVATTQHVTVQTTYHNRSSDRSREVKIIVEWSLDVPSNEKAASAPPLSSTRKSTVTPVSRALVDDVLWSVAHQGCDVFTGADMRPLSQLRECYASNQPTPEASEIIKNASSDQIREATSQAIARSRDEYQVRNNFDWVMVHEGQRNRFSELAQQGRFSDIRSIYKDLQGHNDKAFNALSTLSDSEINDLVNGRWADKNEDNQALGGSSISLTDHIGWAIIHAGCGAFAGEAVRPPEELRECYLKVQTHNHDGEAFGLVATAPPTAITLGTERAVAKIKDQYPVEEILNKFLINSGELDHFKNLIHANKFEEVRKVYASSQAGRSNAPYLLYALAGSEIAAVVNQYRLDVEIPPNASADVLESIAGLLKRQTVNITGRTTETGLAEIACGGVSPFLSATVRPPPAACRTLVRRAMERQKFTTNAAGVVTGGEAITIPTLPRLGVPALVAFRPGVSASLVNTTLANSGTPYAIPQSARLIRAELGTRLSADTVQHFGDSGLRWYASAIAADRILHSDLALSNMVVRVGIIDAGVDTAHTQLLPFFWKLPVALPNIPWQKGSIGYDYINETANPAEDNAPNVDGSIESHGTHVTGLVTARALASWLPEINMLKLEEHLKVYSLKIATGKDGTIPDFAYPGQAIADSLPNQIHLLNLSLEGPRFPYMRADLVRHSSDALIVLAAGNDQQNLNQPQNLHLNGTFRDDDGKPLSNVIIVAALMDDGTLTPDSNRGDLAVEIAAPGNNIYSTIQGGGFGAITGTSQAAPLVTSTAAILLSEHEAYPSSIKERILATCDWDNTLKEQGLVAEGCKLNMAKAIVSQTDIVELVQENGAATPQWLRGSVSKDQFQLNDSEDNAIDSSAIQRIWFTDHSGNVRVAVQGAGHKSARLSLAKIVIRLDPGQSCPVSSNPCEIPVSQVRDVVFRWEGTP